MQSPVGHVGVIPRHFLANAHAGHKRDRGNIKFNTVCTVQPVADIEIEAGHQ